MWHDIQNTKDTGTVVRHYQLMGWEDGDTVGDDEKLPMPLKEAFLALVEEVNTWQNSRNGPVIVHCR